MKQSQDTILSAFRSFFGSSFGSSILFRDLLTFTGYNISKETRTNNLALGLQSAWIGTQIFFMPISGVYHIIIGTSQLNQVTKYCRSHFRYGDFFSLFSQLFQCLIDWSGLYSNKEPKEVRHIPTSKVNYKGHAS